MCEKYGRWIINLVLALLLGAKVPTASTIVLGLLLGFGAFGLLLATI